MRSPAGLRMAPRVNTIPYPAEPDRAAYSSQPQGGSASQEADRPTWLRQMVNIAIVSIVYFLGGVLGSMLPPADGTTVWPPAGIALAALLILGFRAWPGILLGAFLVGLFTVGHVIVSGLVAVGQTAEGLAGAWLVHRFARGCRFYERPGSVVTFALLAGLLTLLCPPFGIAELLLLQPASGSASGLALLVWWLGEAMSVVVLVPLVVLWRHPRSQRWTRLQAVEMGALAFLLVVVSAAVFGSVSPTSAQGYLLPYLCLPFPVWVALRFGPRETALATCIQGAVALWGTLHGYGPFVHAVPANALLAYQAFMIFNSVMSLTVAAVVDQRRQTQEALQRAHNELEVRVQLRTRDLQTEIEERKRAEEALRQAKVYAEDLIRTAPAMIVGLDADGTIQIFNETAERLTDYSRAEVIGRNCFEVLVPKDRSPQAFRDFQSLCSDAAPLCCAVEHPIVTKGGQERLISWRTNQIEEDGRVVGTISFGVDRTEHKAMESALADSEMRYRRLFETAKDGIMILNSRTGEISDINPFLTEMLNCSRGEVVGRKLWEVVPSQHVDACRAAFEELQHRKYIRYEHLPLRTKDGRHVDVEFVSNAYLVGDEEVIQCNIRDITQRRQAEAELLQAREELERRVLERTAELQDANRSLETQVEQRMQAEIALSHVLRRLVDAQETERRRVARELHDEMGQELAGLKLGLRLVKDGGPFSTTVEQGLGDLEETADRLMRDMHRLAWELRPPALDDFGLLPVLQRYAEEWSRRSGVAVDFHEGSMGAQRLPATVETTLYRVTQEALTNVLKHAKARRVSVLLERRMDGVSLIIEDDGEGFDAQAALRSSVASGKLGLLGMQERVMLIGGSVEIESAPGVGTTVYVRIHTDNPRVTPQNDVPPR
jgi:PAS domain S-box-containing protein